MSAAFNVSERGDSSVSNEAKTSEKPQFDIQRLYSDLSATTRNSTANKSADATEIDFSVSESPYASKGGTNFEQETAMEVARRFSSIDDESSENNGGISLDREDVGRMVEVYGDMYNVQDSLEEGDTSEAQQWLSELRSDLTAFARGIFDSPSGNNEDCEDNHSCERNEDRQDRGEEHQESNGEHHQNEENGEHAEEGGEHSEENGEHSEENGEHHEGGEEPYDDREHFENVGDQPGNSSEDFTPEDSMVLLQNDMQELTEALASGDKEKAQKVLARLNRHLIALMRQLNPQTPENNEEGGTDGGTEEPPRDNWWDRAGNPGRGDNPIGFNPPAPGDFFGQLPNPGDLLGGLPNPGDLLGGLPNPGDLLGGLPAPGDLPIGLPNPRDLFDSLPTPGDIIGSLPGLPQPPNPHDFVVNLPQPPNPRNIFDSLPKPSDLFDIF